MDVSHTYQHAPRVTRPYDDISGAITSWADRSERLICCEHSPDEGCRQTHVHLGIWNCDVGIERLKRLLKEKTNLSLSGNKDWAWVHENFPDGLPPWEEIAVEPLVGPLLDTPGKKQIFQYLRYMIKGNMNCVKFVKNISSALVDEACKSWAVPSSGTQAIQTITIVDKRRERPPPYQHSVIMDATAEWYNHKREMKEKGDLVDSSIVIEYVCNAMRKYSKGINPHMVRDLSYAVLYDDMDYKDLVLQKCKKYF